MDDIVVSLISIIIGSLAGIVYGLSFTLWRERRVLSFINTVIRLSLVGVFIFYLLRSPSIQIILLLPSFLITFWLTVLRRKASVHERL